MTTGFNEINLDNNENADKIVILKFKEKLTKSDYDEFVPMLESQMHDGSAIRLLVELHDFEGWTAGALWEDTKFGARHFHDIERLAVVGEARWQKGMTVFLKPFTAAEVRYFDMNEIESAQQWIHEP